MSVSDGPAHNPTRPGGKGGRGGAQVGRGKPVKVDNRVDKPASAEKDTLPRGIS